MGPIDPMLTSLAEASREAGLSVKQFEAMVPKYLAAMDEVMGAPMDPVAELAKLGDQGAALVATNEAYLDAMLAQGKFTADQHMYAKALFGTGADGMMVFDALRQASGQEQIPMESQKVMPKHTIEELHQMIGDDRYIEGSEFAAEVEAGFLAHHGEAPSGGLPASPLGSNLAALNDKKVVEEEYKTKRAY